MTLENEAFEISVEELRKCVPELSKTCQHCNREILRTWMYCPRCGKLTSDEEVGRLTMTDAENASHVLNCLIGYHERAMGRSTDNIGGNYLHALRYALALTESLFEQESGDTVQE